MNQEQQGQTPYEFDNVAKGASRWNTVGIIALAAIVTGGLIAGAAFAITQPEHLEGDRDGGPLGPAPSYSLQPYETGEPTHSDNDHIIVTPVVPVKPKASTKPSKLPKPAFTKPPHFGGGDDEHERGDD